MTRNRRPKFKVRDRVAIEVSSETRPRSWHEGTVVELPFDGTEDVVDVLVDGTSRKVRKPVWEVEPLP